MNRVLAVIIAGLFLVISNASHFALMESSDGYRSWYCTGRIDAITPGCGE